MKTKLIITPNKIIIFFSESATEEHADDNRIKRKSESDKELAKKSKELTSGWSHTSEANKRQQLIKLMKEEAEKKEVIQQMSKEELELDLKRKKEVIAET